MEKKIAKETASLKTSKDSVEPPNQYTGPLGWSLQDANLIEAGRQEWTAHNPNVVCYNCETPGHYESRCWKPRVSPEIRAENVQRINAGRQRSGLLDMVKAPMTDTSLRINDILLLLPNDMTLRTEDTNLRPTDIFLPANTLKRRTRPCKCNKR